MTTVFVTVARAEDPGSVTARLEWQRPSGSESCIDGVALTTAVNRRWGRSVFVDRGRADILLRGTIERTAQGTFRASVELERSDGTSLGSRELVTGAPDCSALDDSVALAVGLMLDVSRRRVAEERRAAEEQPSRPEVVSGPIIAIPSDTVAPREPIHVEPWVAGEGVLGLLPSVALAGRAGVAIEPRRFVRVEVAGSFFAPSEERADATRGVRLSAWTADIALCPFVVRSASLAVHGCVSERFGQVRAQGFGFAESTTVTEPLSELGVGGVLTVPLLAPLGLRVGARAEVPLVRYRFVFSDISGSARAVYHMAPFTGSAEVGLSLRW